MNAAQRRKVILERLTEADAPLSASVLAGELGVSRQIVVGDVALLRASGTQIDATPRGYPWRTRFTVSCAATSTSPAGTTWTILSSRRRIRPSAC